MANIAFADQKQIFVPNNGVLYDIKEIKRNNVVIWQGGLDFSYAGTWAWLYGQNDPYGNWAIGLLTSGTLNISCPTNVDIHCVGGGSAGGDGDWNSMGNGGGGGYAKTVKNITLTSTTYAITVGLGGTGGGSANGGDSSFGSLCKASGGRGRNGGSGGACEGANFPEQGSMTRATTGGSNGGNGGDFISAPWVYFYGGKGQIAQAGPLGETGNTYDFGDSSLTLRCGGGGTGKDYYGGVGSGGSGGGGQGQGGSLSPNGTANYGGGGGGGSRDASYTGGNGGSGIVIIRNHR